MVQIEGKYKRTKADNYEAFLNKMGVGFILRKAATSSSPVMDITKNGDKWKIVTSTSLKSMELNFELGKSFEEETIDGRKVTTTVTAESPDTWVTMQVAKDGKRTVKAVRKFTDAGIDIEMSVDGVSCKQFFERQ